MNCYLRNCHLTERIALLQDFDIMELLDREQNTVDSS